MTTTIAKSPIQVRSSENVKEGMESAKTQNKDKSVERVKYNSGVARNEASEKMKELAKIKKQLREKEKEVLKFKNEAQ
jgi:hypothetical protein